MSSSRKPSSDTPSADAERSAVPSQPAGVAPVSRRDFLAATAATGIAFGAAPSVSALAQETAGPASPAAAPQGVVSNPLPSGEAFEMYDGTAAGAVLAQLRAAGVRMLFHTNTSGFGPLWEAVDAAGDVQVINVTHEGHAVAVAAGYAMASRKLGFFFGSGAGVGNSISNLYCAWKDRVPLLVTYSHGNLSAQGKDGFESWDDTLRPTEPFTMWTANLLTDEMAEITRRAIRFAYGPPSGPVTMVWGTAQAGERVRQRIDKIDLAKARHQFRAPTDAIQQAARWLVEAKNPVFVVGPEVFEDGATADLLALAEKLSVPVTDTEDDLYANFPTDHPLYMGQMRTLRYPRRTDLMIGFGEGFKRREPQPGTPTVHISHDPVILGRVYPVELAIASDVRLAIRDLSDAVDGLLTRDRIARIRATRLAGVSAHTAELKKSREIARRAFFDRSPLSWERVGFELERLLDKNAVIVPELGTQAYKMLNQFTFGGENKAKYGRTIGSALGWGVAASFGVQLGLPDRQVVALQGDGGFLFGQSEALWSIARYEAPMLLVIMNNHLYNETRARNMNGGGRFFEEGRDYNGYLGNPNVDFAKIGEAYGLRGETVKTAGELVPALQRAMRSMRDGKAVLLDIEVEEDGPSLSQPTWYQRHSIAEIQRKARTV
jgi:thiamine pyrophosphate-dependent acetolactate synthase large subunit-like protein